MTPGEFIGPVLIPIFRRLRFRVLSTRICIKSTRPQEIPEKNRSSFQESFLIKELYSLMNYSGNTGSAGRGGFTGAVPFINTDYFDFRYGDTSAGERLIDAQWLSSTQYVYTTMGGAATLFGVNFADGRIKGYGYSNPNTAHPEKKFFARYVRGNGYGQNDFRDNGDETVTDRATGLMWMKTDSGKGMDWEDALEYAETADFSGYSDWRLPNAKELQYIVDYERSPDTTGSAAIDPVFKTSVIKNEAGQKDFPYFWTSTTHLEGMKPGKQGVYIAFGRGMGQMNGRNLDVHGAGTQRSDPKSGQGNISKGPQGDWIRVNNFVRLVRGGSVVERSGEPMADPSAYPHQLRIENTSPDTRTSINALSPGSRTQPPAGSGTGRFILRQDRNGDGRISRDEFKDPSRHFDRFDRNNDGYISEDEAPQGPPPGKRRVQ